MDMLVKRESMTSVADAIRTKGETSAQLVFPSGFVSTIWDIQTGVELNFDVVGGRTKPDSPKKNTIWVDTGADITRWVFNANEPSDPVEGMVWICTGESSPVRITALNCIVLCPVSAKQYNGVEWEDVPAKIYQDGVWVELATRDELQEYITNR